MPGSIQNTQHSFWVPAGQPLEKTIDYANKREQSITAFFPASKIWTKEPGWQVYVEPMTPLEKARQQSNKRLGNLLSEANNPAVQALLLQVKGGGWGPVLLWQRWIAKQGEKAGRSTAKTILHLLKKMDKE